MKLSNNIEAYHPVPKNLDGFPHVIEMDHAYFPYPWTTGIWNNLQNNGQYILHLWRDPDGTPFSFALYNRIADDPTAHLMKILVTPEWRKEGKGKELLIRGEAFLRELGVTGVYLEVAVDNKGAMALYESCGYKALRELKSFYSDGKSAFSMLKNFA